MNTYVKELTKDLKAFVNDKCHVFIHLLKISTFSKKN